MKNKNLSILFCCPVKHIEGFKKKIKFFSKYKILEDPVKKEISRIISKFDIIFTNPNKLKFVFDENLLSKAKNLKIFCTASTGTAHVNTNFLKKKKIKFLSITKDYTFLKKIKATAELAFALTISHLRFVPFSFNNVKKYHWNYLDYIGEQFDQLKVGIVGFGRLGKIYANYCHSFGARIYVYDPFKKNTRPNFKKVSKLENIFKNCDVVSLHLHLNEKTKNLVNKYYLNFAKKNLILVNTSRGEIVNDIDLINFLKINPNARYGTDVLSNENSEKIKKNKIIQYSIKTNQIIITPHIGGMTKFSQKSAFLRSLDKVINHLRK